MQDIYDFFYDINRGLIQRGLLRMDDMLRPAIMSGLLSDMLTASLSKHSRALTVNLYHNGHPDLVVNGVYAGNRIKAGEQGVEIKTTRKSGGAVDTHGARSIQRRLRNRTGKEARVNDLHRNLSSSLLKNPLF